MRAGQSGLPGFFREGEQPFPSFLETSALAVRRRRAYVRIMFWRTLPVGRILGIPVKLHFTFPIFLLVLVLMETFSRGPAGGLLAAAVLAFLFLFVLLHELGHSVVARRYGIPILDITLFPFGGMARTLGMPRRPGQELLISLAGPAVNLVLALLILPPRAALPGGWAGALLDTLLLANLMLAGFNLLPAFPLDGGRVLRALLSLRWGHLRATVWAVRLGWLLALLLAGWGMATRRWMLVIIALFIMQAGGGELRLARRLDQRA